MKLLVSISILVFLIFLFSCNSGVDKPASNDGQELSNQDKAEQAAKDWVNANANTNYEYEAVGFGELDSIIEYTREIQRINNLILEETVRELQILEEQRINYLITYALDDEPSKMNIDSLKKLVEGAEKEFTGYRLSHSVRIKFEAGEQLEEYVFHLDTVFNVIDYVIVSNTSYHGVGEVAGGEVNH